MRNDSGIIPCASNTNSRDRTFPRHQHTAGAGIALGEGHRPVPEHFNYGGKTWRSTNISRHPVAFPMQLNYLRCGY